MTGLMSMLIGSVLPQVSNLVKSLLNIKQDKMDKAQEIEILKLQLQKEQANQEIEFRKADAEEQKAIAEFYAKQAEFNAERSKVKSGIKWVDASETLVRFYLGILTGALLTLAAWQALKMGSPIWEATQLWGVVELVVGYFVGYGTSALTAKKVYK